MIPHETELFEPKAQRTSARSARAYSVVRGKRPASRHGYYHGLRSDAAAGFAAAYGRIRSLMGRALHWRVTPELRFMLDASVDEAQRIAEALAGDAGRNEESARKNADFDDSVYHRDGEDDDFEDEE